MSWRSRLLVLAVVIGWCEPESIFAGPVEDLQKEFLTPGDDARPMVRWWWFGPAVTRAGIDRELAAMKSGGIGGAEVQPTYPLAVDGTVIGREAIRNIKWMSPEYLEMLGYTAAKAKGMGMRMDLTLGSGWPYGGPMFTQAEGTKQLEVQSVAAPAMGADGGMVKVAGSGGGRNVFAAFAGPAGVVIGGGRRGAAVGAAAVDLTGFAEVPVAEGMAKLPAGFAGGQVICFGYKGAGLTMVKRPAYGADGPVIDHLNGKVVDKFIELVAEPELKACGANPPRAIFCDSLEVTGENWTDDFLAEFQKRRGYDLRPLLPALVGNFGERTADIRHDYGETVTELFDENFNAKFRALAEKYHTRFRIQGYGSPPAALESYAYADLPEGEGGGDANWRAFRATRYASSASHLMNVPVASSETFTWLHDVPFRATPVDIKGEVDMHFLEGINQIVCHGWPYTPPGAEAPGWSFYAAAVFDDKNPWYVAMPEISGYMQRVSGILRAGKPANDIAVYMDDGDVWAGAGPGWSSMNATWTKLSGFLNEALAAGYNLDGWDDGMLALKGKAEGGKLAFGDVEYGVVVLDGAKNMPLATARKLEEFAKGGGILMCIGEPPSHVPGYKVAAGDQEILRGMMQRLFKDAGAPGILVGTEGEFGAALGKRLVPDFVIEPANGGPANAAIGAVHRHTEAGEVYFVANTGNQGQAVKATFRVAGMEAEEWNPLNGSASGVEAIGRGAGTTTVGLDLDAYGSTVVVFSKREKPLGMRAVVAQAMDLSRDWTVTFGEKVVQMETLKPWAEVKGDVPEMRNFSGVATYKRELALTAEQVKEGKGFDLDFGPYTVAAGGAAGGGRFAAAIDAPVREAAVVFINGTRAGAAWCAPYRVEIPAGLLKAGENDIRIEVGNTEVNAISASGFPNYDAAALNQAFGRRFDVPNVSALRNPLPSGLMGPITLEMRGK